MSKRYTVQEVFNMIGKDILEETNPPIKSDSIEVDGYLVYKDSWRYRTFYQKGTKCVCCGKEGIYFKLQSDSQNIERGHFNLYAEDGTLITKDHIYPKSKGGRDCIENFQTMCTECNKKKDNKIPEDIPEVELKSIHKMEIKATCIKNNKSIYFENLEKATQYICANVLRIYKNGRAKHKEVARQAIRATIKLNIAIEGKESYCGYKWERI